MLVFEDMMFVHGIAFFATFGGLESFEENCNER